MARASAQFRPEDVTTWGIVALVCGALAVLSANTGAIVPDGSLAGLHASRLGGATLGQVRAELAQLKSQTDELQRNDLLLTQRVALSEQSSGDLVKRIGSLEVSVPSLLETGPGAEMIDRAAVTASIDQEPATLVDVPGGSARLMTKPMLPVEAAQTMPQAFPDQQTGDAVGVAIGPAIAVGSAQAQWEDLAFKAGPLLLGLQPLLAAGSSDGEAHLVAGPLTAMAEATALCRRLEKLSIACLPMPYQGEDLSQ